MQTSAERLAAGWQRVQQGTWREAEQILRQVLLVEPQNADALYLLGVVASQ